MFDAYEVVKLWFELVTSIFFREIRTSGVHQVPKDGPCIFLVAPHANQFVDPGMVLISNPRRFAPLMAESSFKRKVIGFVARLLKAIPVIRPQDLATKGTGTIQCKDNERLIGQGTRFQQEIRPRDLLQLSKTVKVEVLEVLSDTELTVKSQLNEDAATLLSNCIPFKVIPHVDQSVLYTKVHERLEANDCVLIFPEGGSHDRTEMLPLKAGFAIMALGTMVEKPNVDVKIVPVGLNYFHPNRFRSRAVISYGAPISVEPEWVESYKQGGSAKREAIAALMNAGYEGLRSVTVNAPSFDVLLIIAAARRLYRPAAEHKLSIDQVVELNRRFLVGYKYFEKDPRLVELARKVQAYNETLKYFGLRDHQVERTATNVFSALPVLISRLLKLLFLAFVGFPSLLANSPIVILALLISQKKQKEALAGSSVKIAARDVVATWKLLVALVFAPALYAFYSVLFFVYLRLYHSQMDLSTCGGLAFALWVAQPFLQYVGMRLLENGAEIYRSLTPLVIAVFNRDNAAGLRSMREQLSNDITTFVNTNGSVALQDFDPHRFDELEPREKQKSALAGLWSLDDLSPAKLRALWEDRLDFGGQSDESAEEESL